MNNKLITIAIPTKDRSQLLDGTLSSLADQDSFNNIEIIICDNYSLDNTTTMLTKYAQYKNITVVRNNTTLTIDENMIKVATFVTTKYFLWLGDDDMVKPKKLGDLIHLLNMNYDFILLNAMFVSEDTSTQYGTTLNIKKDVLYTNPLYFFKENWSKIPFGTLVVKTKLFNNSLHKADRFIGTSHAYSGILFDYLAEEYIKNGSINILAVSNVYTLLRRVKKTWQDSADRIVFLDIPKWFSLLDVYYEKESKEILHTYLRKLFSIKTLILHRYRSKGYILNYK